MNLRYLDCQKCFESTPAAITARAVICDYCVQRMVGLPEAPKAVVVPSYEAQKERKAQRAERHKELTAQRDARVQREHQLALEKMEKTNQRHLHLTAQREIKKQKSVKLFKPRGWQRRTTFAFEGEYYAKGKKISKSKYDKLMES